MQEKEFEKKKKKNIEGMQVFDSRGNPTIQVKVTLEDGTYGKAIVPSGVSTGRYEAFELRDGDFQEYNGKSVKRAVENVNKKIQKSLIGENALNQEKIDEKMIKLDGTKDKSKLGANAILGVSIAVARAAAKYKEVPLYKYIGGMSGNVIPIPMMNILSGGRLSDNNINIQEFMIVPVEVENFEECMQICVEVYQVLKEILKKQNLITAVGDEGGFAPDLEDKRIDDKKKSRRVLKNGVDELAIDLILEAIEKAGYKPGKDVAIALDMAANEMRKAAKSIEKEGYYFWKTDEYKTKEDMIQYIENLVTKYPIVSVEDALGEEDWKEWKLLTRAIGDKIQIVGDDLFVTNYERLEKGIKNKVANAILIKPNQIGTLTETLRTINLARKNGYKIIISHRSGETEDTFIADLAVATNAGQIKAGAPCRSERVSKYNRLLNIERELKNGIEQ